MNEIVLKSVNLNKYFGITHAVNDVSLSFEKGEIHGLIGENGSGKSTFCSMLSGIYPITSGAFFLEDNEINVKCLVDANNLGISIIVQEIGTLPGLTVAENLFLGEEDKFMKGPIKNTKKMNQAAQKLLNSYGYKNIKASTMIDHYSFEDRKIVEIIKAVYFTPKILIVDETTTALSQSGRDDLFKIMKDLKKKGTTVIFISHDLVEVIDHCDRVSCLRDGQLVGTVKSSEVDADDLKRMMVGRDLSGKYYRTDYDNKLSDEVVLTVENVSVKGEINNINLQLHRGEILGIGGLSECGMHELGKAIFGASYSRKGHVYLSDGTQIKSISQAIKKNIAYSSKDRDNESIVVADTIKSNIVLPSINTLANNGILNDKTLNEFAQKYADLMSVKMVSIDQDVVELSGGNKQKVVLARWLGKDSDILILDSPTRGIDVKVKANIYNLMYDLKEAGKSIIMISEELPELIGMSDRIIIMKNGELSGSFLRSEKLTEEDIIEKMI
ncbi:MAG: sugar ABC transporter ATP-binding protein [Pleomorphochaeta sp.]